MIKAVVNTQKYFQAPSGYFWHWAENGEVIEWSPGATICYRDDLIALLKEVSLKGLPPFGALLLIMSACKEKPDIQQRFILRRFFNAEHLFMVDDVYNFMELVHALPPGLRTGRARIHLLYEVFEEAGFVFSHIDARNAVDELNSGRIDKLVFEPGEKLTQEQAASELRYLSEAYKRFRTTDTLALRLRTGLDRLPPPASDLPEITPPDLLDQLAQDPKTAGIARLSRRLIAALNIPIHSAGSGDQSYGGITDITNRGNYDKLLLSELAHDNDLLMARLVNNEALYFRREEPPDNPKRQRTILVDTTIKMWGIPRVFAISAALAFARNTKHGEWVEGYALGGKLFTEISLDSKEGIISALQVLDHSLHCGKALQQAVTEITGSIYNEFIFITGDKVFDSPAFHASLSQVREALGFVLTVNRDGEACFYECRKGRMKLLNTAKFDLEELLFAPVVVRKTKKEETDTDLPAFLLKTPSPLLFPKVRIKQGKDKIFYDRERGMVVVNETQRLLYISDYGSGAYELLNYIEKGTYSFGWSEQDDLYVTVTNWQRKLFKCYFTNPVSGDSDCIDLSEKVRVPREIIYRENKFYIRADSGSHCFDCHTREMDEQVGDNAFNDAFARHRAMLAEIHDEDKENEEQIYPLYLGGDYSVMYRMREMYISSERKLVLGNYTVDLVSNNEWIRIKENVTKPEGLHYASDIGMNQPMLKNKAIKFSVRRWKEGSEAVIDSRGFLHLKSSDPAIPAMSIALITGWDTACWSADGVITGIPHLFTDVIMSKLPAADFYKKYIQRFIDRIVQ